jgi:hypothetical protein
VSYDATETLQIALRDYLTELGSSNETRACQLAAELERELGREVANGG